MFSYHFRVQKEHTHGDILGHDKLVTILYNARESFLEKYDLSEANINGLVLLTTSLHIDYLGMVLLGEKVSIELSIEQKDKIHIQWQYVIYNCRNQNPIARANSTSICYSMQKQRVARASNLFHHISSCV